MEKLFEGKSESHSNTTNSTILSSTTPFSRPHQLSHSAVAGIAVGCIAFVVVVAAGATFMIKHKSKRSKVFELSDHPPQVSSNMSSSELQRIELSALQRPKEMLTEHQDRAELSLSHKSRRSAEELNSGASLAVELPV